MCFRQFDGYSGADGEDVYTEDSYEQQLGWYSQSQRERREARRESHGDSPPGFTRSTSVRHRSPSRETLDHFDEPYPERFVERVTRDTDSQSGDRESVRSYRSGDTRREFHERTVTHEDRFPADTRYVDNSRERRAHSPSNSEFSLPGRSPGKFRSRSTSPPKDTKTREYNRDSSPPTPVPDEYDFIATSQPGSPSDFGAGKVKASRYDRQLDYMTDGARSKARGDHKGVLLREDGRAKDRPERRESKEDGLRATVKSEVMRAPRKLEMEDREKERARREDDERRASLLERQFSRSSVSSVSGSGGRTPRPHGSPRDTRDKLDTVRVTERPAPRELPPKDMYEPSVMPTTPGEKMIEATFSSPESSKDSDQESYPEGQGSHSSGEVLQLESEKLRLINLLQQLDDSGSMSDHDGGEWDEEGSRRAKRAKLGDVFDLDRTPSLSMRRWQETIRHMDVEDIIGQVRSGELPAQLKPLDNSKFRPIDSTQSLRKQMELRRQDGPRSANVDVSDPGLPSSPIGSMDIDEETYEPCPDKSPREIPTEFIPKRRRKVDPSEPAFVKSARKYRTKRPDEPLELSSGEDDGQESEFLVPGGTASSARKDAGDKDIEWSIPQGLSHEADHAVSHTSKMLAKKASPLSLRRDSRTDPKIIPESVIETGGEGCSTPRRPQEPRTLPDVSRRTSPMSLPLPKFAQTLQLHSPKASPKLQQSPKVLGTSPQLSPALTKIASPPFSPGAGPSPQLSPALPNLNKDLTPTSGRTVTHRDRSPPPPPPPPPPLTPVARPQKPIVDTATKDSEGAEPLSPGSPQIDSSDSDIPEFGSPGRPSLDERLRMLDEKLEKTTKPPSKSPAATSAATTGFVDYREKYRIRKRDVSATTQNTAEGKTEPSDIMKSVLQRSSIFDQDLRRLEQSHEKYEPKLPETSLEALHAQELLKGTPLFATSASGLYRQGSMGPSDLMSPPNSAPPTMSADMTGQHVLLQGRKAASFEGRAWPSNVTTITFGEAPVLTFDTPASDIQQAGGLDLKTDLTSLGSPSMPPTLKRQESAPEQFLPPPALARKDSVTDQSKLKDSPPVLTREVHESVTRPSGLVANMGPPAAMLPSLTVQTSSHVVMAPPCSPSLQPAMPVPGHPPVQAMLAPGNPPVQAMLAPGQSPVPAMLTPGHPPVPAMLAPCPPRSGVIISPGAAPALLPPAAPIHPVSAAPHCVNAGVKRKACEAFDVDAEDSVLVMDTPAVEAAPEVVKEEPVALEKQPATAPQPPAKPATVAEQPDLKKPKITSEKKDKKTDSQSRSGHKDTRKHQTKHTTSSSSHRKTSSARTDSVDKKEDKAKEPSSSSKSHKDHKPHTSSKDKSKKEHVDKRKDDDKVKKEEEESEVPDKPAVKDSSKDPKDNNKDSTKDGSKESSSSKSRAASVSSTGKDRGSKTTDKSHDHKSEKRESSTSEHKTEKRESTSTDHKAEKREPSSSSKTKTKTESRHKDSSKQKDTEHKPVRKSEEKSSSDKTKTDKTSDRSGSSSSRPDKSKEKSPKIDKTDKTKSHRQESKERSEKTERKTEKKSDPRHSDKKKEDKSRSHSIDKSGDKSKSREHHSGSTSSKDSTKDNSKDSKSKARSEEKRDDKRSTDKKEDRSQSRGRSEKKSDKRRSSEKKREKSTEESRELKLLRQYEKEFNEEAPYVSMYDMVKRRSCKEKTREQDTPKKSSSSRGQSRVSKLS